VNVSSAPRSRPGRTREPQLADAAQPGDVIDGRYRIVGRVGRGGMGVVYRAEQITLKRPVAVKVLHPTLAVVPELRSRFEREALAIGKIDHPNCVGVLDFGQTSTGALYLVMEFLEGESLGDRLDREERLPPALAISITRHILRGLEHAHAAGIIHRDIKPENVILTTHDGVPEFAKILDFGIAKVLDDDGGDEVKLTQAGMAFGTPIYMSPEQAVGNPLDGRADLYGVSVMLFEMLVGQPPFYSDDKLELLSMHTTRPVPWMGDLDPAANAIIPEPLELLVRRGLAKRPEERFADAAAFIAALDRVAADAPELPGGDAAEPRAPSDGAPRASLPPRGGTRDDASAIAATMSLELAAVTPPALTPRRPWGTYVVIAIALAVLGAALSFVLSGDAPRTGPAPGSLAGKAAQALAAGNPREVVRLVSAEPAAADDAEAQLQLGHAQSSLHEYRKALAAYTAALRLSPGLERDATLRANLATISDDKDLTNATGAFELMLNKTSVPGAADKLLAAAAAPDPERRAAIAPLVERLGLADKVDRLKIALLDLEDASGCENRREAVARLRAIGDPRAIAPLEAAAVRKGKSGQYKGKPINACLADEALAAVQYLRMLSGASAPTGGSGSGS
jgi:tetratricopeptide (TPR) repeat protein